MKTEISKVKISKEPYEPLKPASHWCSNCDALVVESEDPKSGRFFVQHGHGYSAKHGAYDGEYYGVMFAVFCNCLKEAQE